MKKLSKLLVKLPFRRDQGNIVCGGIWVRVGTMKGFSGGASGKEPACQCRRHKRCGFDPGLERSLGGGLGNSLQYSRLENPMDRGAWRSIGLQSWA